MEKTEINLLYVDDEPNNLVSFSANFRKFCNIYTAKSAEEGKEILKHQTIHIIITDQRMPNITGIEFLESIIVKHADPIRMLLTGYSDMEAVIGAINKGQVYRYISKPIDVKELKSVLNDAYGIYKFRRNNKELLEKYKKLFEASSEAIFVVDDKGKLIEFNQATIDLLKYSRNQLQSIPCKDLLENPNKLESILNELRVKGKIKNSEIKLIDSHSQPIDCLVSIDPLFDDNKKNIGYHGIIRDVTKQKKANNMLVRTILSSQEKERNEFALDLHDSISQQLASVTFYIQTINNINDPSQKNISQTLSEVNTSLNGLLNEIRDLCYKIIPRTIIDFGLEEAIKDFCQRVQLTAEVTFTIRTQELSSHLDKNLEITLFRIIQELIHNAIEHGKATKMAIIINSDPKNVSVTFQDNGIGYNLKDFHEYHGTGLKNIKLRIDAHNGEIKTESVSGQGTSSTIVIPISDPSQMEKGD